ncbi:MAG: GDSL-type esterase/lipase family protein [Anaerolineae bacterium]|nr:GDSL-type esterase/lipase family protein [Anaerolineae bacterium]
MTEKSVKHFSLGRIIRISLMLLGGLMIAVALLVDVVMTGLSSGIGPLQISVAVFGLFLMILPWIPTSFIGRAAIALVTILIMLIVMEFALSAAGFEPEYRSPANFDANAEVDFQVSTLRLCDDERGCHWNVESLSQSCADESLNRMCRINEYGSSSDYEFTADTLPDHSYRILVLGDSFTWGASADYGQGWVDVMARDIEASTPVIVWNAAMPGTGTQQAIMTAQNLLPIMQPDLVILGFHSGNDFADNLYPYDRFINVIAEDGNSVIVQQYSLNSSSEAFHETDAVIYYRANGYTVSSNEGFRATIDELLRRTRLGTLLVGAYRVLTWDSTNLPPTQALLEDLQSLVIDNSSQFLVVIIPEQIDTRSPTHKYRGTITVLNDANVAFVDSLPWLVESDFENANSFDKHLNNAGHGTVGQMMADCVQQIIETDNLTCSE